MNIAEIEEKSQKAYEELQKLQAEPDVTIPGQESPKQKRIAQLKGALAAFGVAMQGLRR